jgi:hypothetical protein
MMMFNIFFVLFTISPCYSFVPCFVTKKGTSIQDQNLIFVILN